MGIINRLRPIPIQTLEKSRITNFFIKSIPLVQIIILKYMRGMKIYYALVKSYSKLPLLFVNGCFLFSTFCKVKLALIIEETTLILHIILVLRYFLVLFITFTLLKLLYPLGKRLNISRKYKDKDICNGHFINKVRPK